MTKKQSHFGCGVGMLSSGALILLISDLHSVVDDVSFPLKTAGGSCDMYTADSSSHPHAICSFLSVNTSLKQLSLLINIL